MSIAAAAGAARCGGQKPVRVLPAIPLTSGHLWYNDGTRRRPYTVDQAPDGTREGCHRVGRELTLCAPFPARGQIAMREHCRCPRLKALTGLITRPKHNAGQNLESLPRPFVSVSG